MHIVVAPDSFKECLSAAQVCEAVSNGILRIIPDAKIISVPVADGGEGTVDALVKATGGKIITVPSVDALMRPIFSYYGVLGDKTTAIVEMAAASGIALLAPCERNPLITSTYGTGLLIKEALEAGYTDIVVAIGGSATNDGGAGMAQALGYELNDINGQPLPPGGGSLDQLHFVNTSTVHPLLQKARITVACDVTNPLVGPLGATKVFGPQKGATAEMIAILEKGMQHYAHILQKVFKRDISTLPGAGAAGGLGGALMVFCNARTIAGFELVSQLTNLEEHIIHSSIVFTAEGKIDAQSSHGKTVSGVARLARQHKKTAIALAGIVSDDLTELYSQGITAIFAIADRPMTEDESKARARELLSNTSEQIMRMAISSGLAPLTDN